MGRISKLHEYTLDRINSKFPHLKARENYYPDWLTSPIGTRLELDIFIDDLNIAAEIQGGQHSFFVPFFHGTQEKFEKQKMYDEHKQSVCRQVGVKLYDIATEKDADVMIYEIEELLSINDNNKEKYFYGDTEIKKSHRERHPNDHSHGKSIDNSEEKRAERVKRCAEKVRLYNMGGIIVTNEKLQAWKSVIENNGYEESVSGVE